MAEGFSWNDWNLEHAAKHGCTVAEIESLARNPGRGYPPHIGDDKYLVVGRGQGGRFIEVVYVIDNDGPFYPIHAMPLTTRRRRGGR